MIWPSLRFPPINLYSLPYQEPMKSYFRRKEFYKKGTLVPYSIEKKIDRHITELNPVRRGLGAKILISKHSGYRPRAYEVTKGRSGNSQHNFEGLGAVDLTSSDLVGLLKLLVQTSSYTRICYYPNQGFIHCDWVGEELVTFLDEGYGWQRTSLALLWNSKH